MATNVVIKVHSLNNHLRVGETTISKVLSSPNLIVKYETNMDVKYESGIVRPNERDKRKVNI